MTRPLAHRLNPMRGRDPAESHRAATPLELLFDLTFVVAFGMAADELAHAWPRTTSAAALLGFGFATFAISWAWINFSWFASAYDTDDWVFRLTTMVQMVGVIILALGLPDDVRVDRRGRDRRQPRHGRRLRRDAGADGLPVAARRPPGSGPAQRVPHLRDHDLVAQVGWLALLVRRDVGRGDVRRARGADLHRARRPADRRAAQGRHAVARAPHRRALRAAGDHHARRGRPRHDRLALRRRRSEGRAGRSTPSPSRSPAPRSPSACGGSTSSCRAARSCTRTASARSAGATGTS